MNFRTKTTERKRRETGRRLAAVSACFAVGLAARGDQVVVLGENFTDAEVVSLTNGLLQFRGRDGAVRSAHLADIDLLIVNRGGLYEDFNEGERLLDAGEPKKAAVRYKRALQQCTDYWRDLIAARLVVAHDRAMEADKAVASLIWVTRGTWAGPVAGARLIPSHLPAKRTGSLARAVRELDGALAAHPQQAPAMLFEVVRYELLRRMDDELAPSAALRVAEGQIPTAIRTDRVYEILMAAMRTVVASDASPSVLASLDRAIEDCPETHLPDFLLLKGETLQRGAIDREDLMRASWPFLRVAIHMREDPRAARGLLGAARVLEQLEDTTGAGRLLRECIASANAEGAVVEEARRALEALGTGTQSND